MSAFQIKTTRLQLRPMRQDDLDPLAEIFADPETMRFYPAPFTREQTQGWIDRSIACYAKQGHGLWAVDLLATGEFIGDCGITMQQVDDELITEIGYHIRRSHWRQGFASEAAGACREWGFANLQMPRLISIVRVGNEASAGVARKIGMHFWKQTIRAGLQHDVFAIDRAG